MVRMQSKGKTGKVKIPTTGQGKRRGRREGNRDGERKSKCRRDKKDK